ncbi:MAG: hypothetical protein PHY30_02235 [Candidatus Pacebacteria bacterium]|nr:hypothetical protein [Candidatus Paceibacterota bacterium]
MKYFYEKLSKDYYRVGYGIKKSIFSKKSKDQKIEIIENSFLGKIFILNGFIHFSERYEFIFSEMMAHFSIFSHPKPEKVLIVSDAERGILKEASKHKSVNEIYFISENKDAYEAAQDNFPSLNLKEISQNPKAKIVFDDPAVYIKNFENYFDIAIIDSKYPKLKSKDFLKDVFKSLTKEGMAAINSGSLLGESLTIKEDLKTLKTIFRYRTTIRIPSIEQVLCNFGVILASKKINVAELNLRVLTTRFKHFREAKKLNYYSPEMHISLMNLPKIYEKEVK